MKIIHYLRPPTNFGGANGYIAHFVSDMNENDISQYITTEIKKDVDVVVFHRSDGMKKKLLFRFRKLLGLKAPIIVQTFHNPTLPYNENKINGKVESKISRLKDRIRFYLSLILADGLYFASKNSIESYHKSKLFSLLMEYKKIGFFPTRLSDELVKVKAKEKPDNHHVFGFLGRRAVVKGADVFESIAQKNSSREGVTFIATWERSSAENIICTGVMDKWDFLSRIDTLVIPNKYCYYDLVFLEALVSNVRVLTTSVGGALDIKHPLFKTLNPETFDELDLSADWIENVDQDSTILSSPAREIRQDFERTIFTII